MPLLRPLLRLCFLLSCCFATLASAQSSPTASGSIEGRVQNAASGDYLNNARVSLAGSDLVALTDESGMFRLTGVPAGPATVRVRFAGFTEQTIPVTVTAGRTTQQDFVLGGPARPDASAATVKMDAFTVQSKKETDAAAIAVNEQRVALGQKSVVSAGAC